MRLWILRPIDELPENDNPWEPWYDKTFGFVIRAENEELARQLAQDNSGDENQGIVIPWLDKRYSSCTKLLQVGEAGIIIDDYHAA